MWLNKPQTKNKWISKKRGGREGISFQHIVRLEPEFLKKLFAIK
jgi:hypothetical protein